MERLRTKLNAEEQLGLVTGPTDYMTGQNRYMLNCGGCGRHLFVDEEIFTRINTVIQAGLDNPFCCVDCEEEYDELFYEG
jgi:hypothetical protein